MSENKTGKYLLYAIGEIVLVVIGILIALQINNANEARKERDREINYLSNLKADLVSEIENNRNFAEYRFQKAKACTRLLGLNEPETKEEVRDYTDVYEQVFIWGEYVPNNNTFKELLSSGNLSLIKNDSIKNRLMELQKRYTGIASGEHHMRREFEEYLYNPHVKNATALGYFDLSKAVKGFPQRLKIQDIPDSVHRQLIMDAKWQHNDHVFKNGLRLAMMNNSYLAGLHENLVLYLKETIQQIDGEIEKWRR